MRDPARVLHRLDIGLALVVTALSLSLHLAFLSSAGALWRDEVNTVAFAELPSLEQVWTALEHDPAPLGTTLALRAWAATGLRTDFELRIFGTCVGVALLAALWIVASLTAGCPPLWGIVLLGLSPAVVRYGDSLRPYGLAAIGIVLTFGFVWDVARRQAGVPPTRLGLAALATILSVQASYASAPLVLAICLAGAVVAARGPGWKRALGVLAIGVPAALSLAPYLPAISRGREALVAAGASVDLARLLGALLQALGSGARAIAWVWIGLAALALAAAVLAGFRRDRASPDRELGDLALYAGMVIALGTTGFLLFLGSTRFTPQSWHFLPLLALIAPCLESVPETLLRKPSASIAKAIAACAVGALLLGPARSEVRIRQTNVDRIAAVLEQQAAPEDRIVVAPWFCGVTFHRYYGGRAPWSSVPPIADLSIHRYDLLKQQMAASAPLDPLFDALERTLQSGGKIWLVGPLRFPAEGERPRTLPPAPLGPQGWNSGPYLAVWSEQVAHFVQTRAQRLQAVPLPPDGPVQPYENLPLYVAHGWAED